MRRVALKVGSLVLFAFVLCLRVVQLSEKG